MISFLETIRIVKCAPQHLEWHQARVEATFRAIMPEKKAFSIKALLDEFNLHEEGVIRCRILYNEKVESFSLLEYAPREIHSLMVVDLPAGYDYRYKYADRKVIEDLYATKGDADDILMLRNGWVTDTSIANIAFRKNERWYTPAQPLLAGTTWKRMVKEGKLIPKPIHVEDLRDFEAWKIFNAMREGEEQLILLL